MARAKSNAGIATAAPPVSNGTIAELLAREAESASGHREIAFRRAGYAAFMWPEEAADLKASDRSLTELTGVGPSIAKRIHRWIDDPPEGIEPPPIRREFLTLAEARRILATDPPFAAEVNGDLQMHTEWSDGAATIAKMAEAAIERGYEFIGITDHTRGLKIANGLDASRLRAQGGEISELNSAFKKRGIRFRVLRSAEMNLNPQGEGDMDPEDLQKLDLVLGCFHSALRREDDQTERYLAGLRNPDIQILGHPQTRVYDRRVGLQADWGRIFAEAARLGKAVEIDGYSDRQDLRVSLLELAREEGVTISLGTDAHHPDQLAFMELSLAAALKAGIPRERILNFRSAAEVVRWAAALRR